MDKVVDIVDVEKWQPNDAEGLAQFSTALSTILAEVHEDEVKQRLIERLCFTEIDDRYISIADAHRRTFEWAFRGPEREADQESSATANADVTKSPPQWDSFLQWMQQPDGLYWITGKPGSGKSTLMKFLYDDPRTHCELMKWAGKAEPPLIMAGFFFWNSGTDMQMSRMGMLRTLLHQIVSDDRADLIPIICPKRWNRHKLLGNDP